MVEEKIMKTTKKEILKIVFVCATCFEEFKTRKELQDHLIDKGFTKKLK